MAKAASVPQNLEPTGTASSWGRFLFALGIMVILCTVCAPLFIDRIAMDGPMVRGGEVSFAHWTRWTSPVGLGGEWRLIWRGPVVVGGPKAGETLSARVPGPWRGLKAPSGG